MNFVLNICILWLCSSSMAANIYVNTDGADTNPGSRDKPVASIARARDIARPYVGKKSIVVHVADGTYYLPETLVFTPVDSGSPQAPVVYRSENEGGAVLSGGSKLSLSWVLYRDGIYKATTPAGLEIDQLFINGKNQRMARYPNYDADSKTKPYQGYDADAFSKARAANWENPAGGYIHAMHSSKWGGYHYLITGKTPQGEVTYEGGWQNNRQMGMHKDYRMVENIFEELDAPGEWFHDAKMNTLYYKPDSGDDLTQASVEVVRLPHLIEFQGSETSPVQHITFDGFMVRHAARTFMDTKEPLLRSDWAIYRGGAVMLTGTEDIRILNTEFDQVGGNAIFVNNYNRRTLVKGCHIHDTGASGVCFVGDPAAVRNPLFEYHETNDLSKIDRTPGPKTNNYPANGTVEDCLIHDIGRVERQPAGVQIEMAMEITVRDCSVYDCARAGINIGDGAWGGHLIERCDVFDTVLETHDHGSFNSWGRDRYWHKDPEKSQAAVDLDPALPFLDAIKTTVIRDSRWRCDHGWDIDLDDGSTNYDIYNNLLLGKGLKLREGFRRHVWNNIIPFGALHPHVWYKKSKDQLSSNIFGSGHRTARMATPCVDETMVDRNLFIRWNNRARQTSVKLGWDSNSIDGDPLFIAPENGDFRVKDDSPALKIGFENFPMDQFGVKKASLKMIARTPMNPSATAKRTEPIQRPKAAVATAGHSHMFWLGARLVDLKGDDFSAYGVSQETGGVILSQVVPNSFASRAGLKEGDVIQIVNGRKSPTIAVLMETIAELGDAPLTVLCVRNQQSSEIKLVNAPFVVIEKSKSATGFTKCPLPSASSYPVSANPATGNQSVATLTDGKLKKNYGPVFNNKESNGGYKIDLGATRSIASISSWSYRKTASRGAQRLTLYGSNATEDPAWSVEDTEHFTALGSIDTTALPTDVFNAASLRARDGTSLGNYRWIIWRVSPVSQKGENSAFQELSVEFSENRTP